MLVAERGGRRTVPVARRRSVVGLGRSLRETGRIGEAEFAAGIRVLREFRLEMGREPMVWWSLASAFAFMLALVLAANLFADAVRDAFDPRLAVRRPRLTLKRSVVVPQAVNK